MRVIFKGLHWQGYFWDNICRAVALNTGPTDTWELIRNANSWGSPLIYQALTLGVRPSNLCINNPTPGLSSLAQVILVLLKFEIYWWGESTTIPDGLNSQWMQMIFRGHRASSWKVKGLVSGPTDCSSQLFLPNVVLEERSVYLEMILDVRSDIGVK